MDPTIDPNTSLDELQTKLFMAAITELIQLARTTDQDHIKLRALTEVARLCNPAKKKTPFDRGEAGRCGDSLRRGGSRGERPPADLTPAAASRPPSNIQHTLAPSTTSE